MLEPFIGEISLFAGNFAPAGWMFCQGQTLPIPQYTALFSLLGTYYGGNGTTNFCLPDLRGCVPVGTGTPRGFSPMNLGETGSVSTHGSKFVGTLGMNYIIAVEGIYPHRP
jgi:microcystin-dependent protein